MEELGSVLGDSFDEGHMADALVYFDFDANRAASWLMDNGGQLLVAGTLPRITHVFLRVQLADNELPPKPTPTAKAPVVSGGLQLYIQNRVPKLTCFRLCKVSWRATPCPVCSVCSICVGSK
jgi:hypothetical protein